MAKWLRKPITTIGTTIVGLFRKIVILYDKAKGEKSLKIISIHDDERDAYEIHTNDGGIIRLYCVIHRYRLYYSAWWCRNEYHRSYKVYGKCEGNIPEKLTTLIKQGVTLGGMLPTILPKDQQKREAIHIFASLILDELKKDQK